MVLSTGRRWAICPMQSWYSSCSTKGFFEVGSILSVLGNSPASHMHRSWDSLHSFERPSLPSGVFQEPTSQP